MTWIALTEEERDADPRGEVGFDGEPEGTAKAAYQSRSQSKSEAHYKEKSDVRGLRSIQGSQPGAVVLFQ